MSEINERGKEYCQGEQIGSPTAGGYTVTIEVTYLVATEAYVQHCTKSPRTFGKIWHNV